MRSDRSSASRNLRTRAARVLPAATLLLASCSVMVPPPAPGAASPVADPGTSPWPAIRAERIRTLLPRSMQETGTDAWIILARENANDPLALHVGAENAGAPAAFLFFLESERVRAVAISGFGEAIALRENGLHDSVVVYERGPGALEAAIAERIRAANPARIAINSGGGGVADGLSYTQRRGLERALGADLTARLVPSQPLVDHWLATKLPQEVAIMREAASLTARLQLEAYATVVPGVTTDADLARYLKRRMRELGVEDGWSPAQNPSVNSGPDRGHSHATERVIQPGDIIQTDFGIKVHGVWVTDIQRFAYVLRLGETAPPPDVQRRWEAAVAAGAAAHAAMRPGVSGASVDSAQRLVMQQTGSAPVPWGTGHPVGYWAHDAGPGLNRRETRALREGQVLAFDSFHAWTADGSERAWGDGTKTLSAEEMVVLTAGGAEYLVPPQRELILVRGR